MSILATPVSHESTCNSPVNSCCTSTTQENTNKAVVADFFSDSPDMSTTAFASVAFTSGISGAFGYFVWPNIDRNIVAVILVLTSVAGVFCYYAAVKVHERKRNGDFL